jgi:MOSC domain-containing protein YiiM
MQEVTEARLIAEFGVEGCAHARSSNKRQVLLVDYESLDAMQLEPGIIRENITSEGLAVNALPIGQRLRIGDSILEVAAVCTPCDQLEKIRPGLRREIRGRRGMLCRVVESGVVRAGDRIDRVATEVALETS